MLDSGSKVEERTFHSFEAFEEGRLRPSIRCHVTLKTGAAGARSASATARSQKERSASCCNRASDLPGRADSEVARHLSDRRDRPSSKEGKAELVTVDPLY